MTPPKETRRRAPGMSPEQRRVMIIAAALPLVAEHGAKVTTGQVARAAGIGEGTIFRAFADKNELLDACMAEAVRPDHAVREIASIPTDLPLADRLTEAADALDAHLDRMGAVAGALLGSGHRSRAERPPADSREQSVAAIRDAITDLFGDDAPPLRVPRDQAAAVFLGLLFARPRTPLSTGDLVAVFLHGALAEPS
ncbi:TetR/AcrR family transcriptional regulator [Actinocatenispora sera]|uniref:TetR/AcrR family transcriptional regulator n=1 Tax=Actinocatenispora sera TaxID=390989 RepID=UPI00340A50BB